MRVVSQNGMIDIPYEHCSLIINRKTFEIEARSNDYRFEPVMADYSSENKAIKAMEMLRETYTGVVIMQNVEPTEEALERLKNANLVLAKIDSQPSNIEYINNTIFQFPQDEEIEV